METWTQEYRLGMAGLGATHEGTLPLGVQVTVACTVSPENQDEVPASLISQLGLRDPAVPESAAEGP